MLRSFFHYNIPLKYNTVNTQMSKYKLENAGAKRNTDSERTRHFINAITTNPTFIENGNLSKL